MLGDAVDAGSGRFHRVRFPAVALTDNEELAVGDARSNLLRCRQKISKAFSFRRQPADETNNRRARLQTELGAEPLHILCADQRQD